MIVVCKPEESKIWYDKLCQNTVDLFRSLDIPVRTLAVSYTHLDVYKRQEEDREEAGKRAFSYKEKCKRRKTGSKI